MYASATTEAFDKPDGHNAHRLRLTAPSPGLSEEAIPGYVAQRRIKPGLIMRHFTFRGWTRPDRHTQSACEDDRPRAQCSGYQTRWPLWSQLNPEPFSTRGPVNT